MKAIDGGLVLAGAALLLGLAACGDDDKKSADTTQQDSVADSTPDADTSPPDTTAPRTTSRFLSRSRGSTCAGRDARKNRSARHSGRPPRQ